MFAAFAFALAVAVGTLVSSRLYPNDERSCTVLRTNEGMAIPRKEVLELHF